MTAVEEFATSLSKPRASNDIVEAITEDGILLRGYYENNDPMIIDIYAIWMNTRDVKSMIRSNKFVFPGEPSRWEAFVRAFSDVLTTSFETRLRRDLFHNASAAVKDIRDMREALYDPNDPIDAKLA